MRNIGGVVTRRGGVFQDHPNVLRTAISLVKCANNFLGNEIAEKADINRVLRKFINDLM